MQQQPQHQHVPAMSSYVPYHGHNLCMATASGHLVPATEIYGTTDDGGRLCSAWLLTVAQFSKLKLYQLLVTNANERILHW